MQTHESSPFLRERSARLVGHHSRPDCCVLEAFYGGTGTIRREQQYDGRFGDQYCGLCNPPQTC
jgi:hypothetical protein